MCPQDKPCGGYLIEDLKFAADCAKYGITRRRFLCVSGHSHYVPAPDLNMELDDLTGGRHCARCGQIMHGVTLGSGQRLHDVCKVESHGDRRYCRVCHRQLPKNSERTVHEGRCEDVAEDRKRSIQPDLETVS